MGPTSSKVLVILHLLQDRLRLSSPTASAGSAERLDIPTVLADDGARFIPNGRAAVPSPARRRAGPAVPVAAVLDDDRADDRRDDEDQGHHEQPADVGEGDAQNAEVVAR